MVVVSFVWVISLVAGFGLFDESEERLCWETVPWDDRDVEEFGLLKDFRFDMEEALMMAMV